MTTPSPSIDEASLAVATHALSKLYGRSTALEAVDLRVPEGAVYMLAGENGAGKSTLLRLLLNLEQPTSGRAEVTGLATDRHGARVRARVGYVPEGFGMGPRWMTVERWLAERTVYYPAWDAGYAWLAVLVLVNTVVSLFYYLRWIAPLYARQEAAGHRQDADAPGRWSGTTAIGTAALSLLLGIGAGALWATVSL